MLINNNKPSLSTNVTHSKYSLRYIVLILVLSTIFLSWHGLERYVNYKKHQDMLMQHSVEGAAAELTALLTQLKTSTSVFSEQYLPLIQYLAKDPENEVKFNFLNKRASVHFPNYFAITIADHKGIPLIGNYDLTVNELCQRSIKEFIDGGYEYDIFIHPHVGTYHFDIMSTWNYQNLENHQGIFFISLKPTLFARVLKNAQLHNHKLYLIKDNIQGLIEVTSEGARIDIKNHNGKFFLSEDKFKNIGFSMPVSGTRWNLVDIPNVDLFSLKRKTIIIQTTSIFLCVMLISFIFFRLIRSEENLHLTSANNFKNTKEKLEHTLEFSNVATWEYNALTKTFRWSKHAINIFNNSAPTTYKQYLEIIIPCHKNDFQTFINSCFVKKDNQHFEHKIQCEQRGEIWVEISGSHDLNNGTQSFKLLGLIQNITNRKVAEQNYINFELQQKDTLLREVHHRIKNNLQGVMSLLEHHKNKEHLNKDILDLAMTQLYSVSLIHGINGENEDNKIEISSLVNNISKTAFNITGIEHKPCYSVTKKHIINSTGNNTVAIALIINELIFNAIKHTPDKFINDIQINIISLISDVVIEIRNRCDDFPNTFDFNEGSGLGTGLTLIRSLLPKKGAEIRFKQAHKYVICHLILKPPILEENHENTEQSKKETA